MQGSSAPFGGKVTSAEGYLLSLWMHECRRVFCDKLVSQSDKDWVENLLSKLCEENVETKLVAEVNN